MSESLEQELKRLRDERQKKFNEEDWEGALDIHDKILELSPSALRYANKGSILYRLDRVEKAIECYRKALEMDPSLKRAKADLERLEKQLKQQGKETNLPLPEEKLSDNKQELLSKLRDERQECLKREDWEGALEKHDKILEVEPTALRHANKGSILYRLGRLQDAADCYSKALEMDSSMERARIDLERLEAQMEEEGLLRPGEKSDEKEVQDRIEELRKKRQAKVNEGDWEGALKIHDEVLALEPTALRYANHGALLYRLGRHKEAIKSYQKALEMDSELQQAKEAISHLEGLMEEESLLSPDTSSGLSPEEKTEKINQYREERQKYLDKKDWVKALELHDKIIEVEPTALRYVNRGSMLYRMKRLQDAVDSYQKALEMDPSLDNAKKDLQRIELELVDRKAKEEQEQAKKEQKEKEQRETQLEEWKNMRQECIENKDWEGALEYQDKIIDLEPTALRYTNKGSILYRLGQVDEAILTYRKALDLDSSLDKAKGDLEQLAENEMDRLRTNRQGHMEDENWEGALYVHDVILALETTPLRLANRGSILYQLGRLQEAMETYKKALEMDPTLEQAREDLESLEEELSAQGPPTLEAVPQEFVEDDEGFLEEFEELEEIEEEPEEEVEEKVTETNVCIGTLSGHRGEITDVKIAKDGDLIISASKDNTIKIWDTKTQKCVRTLEGHEDWVRCVSVTQDNTRIVSASDDWTSRIWDLKSGKCEKVLKGHSMPVLTVGVSKNNRFIFTSSRDKTIKIWDGQNGKSLSTLEGHDDWVNCFQVAPDGNKAISASLDGTIRIWNVLGWRCTNTIEAHDGWVEHLLITDDGKQLISSGSDKNICIWGVSGGKKVHTLEGHHDLISNLYLNKECNTLVSGSKDQTIRIWDVASGECNRVIRGQAPQITRLILSPDEKHIFSAANDSTIWIWRTEDGGRSHVLDDHEMPVSSIVTIADKNWVVSGSKDNTVKIWDANSLVSDVF